MGHRQRSLEALVIDPAFWNDRRVLLTGHTGFKGAWAALLLRAMGAEIFGFALPSDNEKSIFATAGVERDLHHRIGDVRDRQAVQAVVEEARPEIVIHMAAQALVRLSYAEPVETYATNVMGTVHVLDAVRRAPPGIVDAVVIVTSDKCYENNGWVWGFRETDHLGGHDPYSNSKGCAELVTDAYRRSFRPSMAKVASGRAGNVIGGGDWSKDRLVPDAIRAFMANKPLRIRNQEAVRPWQHVLDPVIGYLVLAERLVKDGPRFAEAWNFGPATASEVAVEDVVHRIVTLWGDQACWESDRPTM
jgi:CDP-glucose 4,6-dehydratase